MKAHIRLNIGTKYTGKIIGSLENPWFILNFITGGVFLVGDVT